MFKEISFIWKEISLYKKNFLVSKRVFIQRRDSDSICRHHKLVFWNRNFPWHIVFVNLPKKSLISFIISRIESCPPAFFDVVTIIIQWLLSFLSFDQSLFRCWFGPPNWNNIYWCHRTNFIWEFLLSVIPFVSFFFFLTSPIFWFFLFALRWWSSFLYFRMNANNGFEIYTSPRRGFFDRFRRLSPYSECSRLFIDFFFNQ